MTNYKKAVEELKMDHPKTFEDFALVHAQYAKDQNAYQEAFDAKGKPFLRLVEEAERRLCSKMEGGGKGKFSANLAEKFRGEVKKIFPLLDFIGAKVE